MAKYAPFLRYYGMRQNGAALLVTLEGMEGGQRLVLRSWLKGRPEAKTERSRWLELESSPEPTLSYVET